jgi:bifunctional non-homologous end joining protein LigD
VPNGEDWQHEIKFDGFRVQIHKLGNEVELYSRNGSRFSRRFPRLVGVLRELPVKSAILDGEIVASDAAGMPDFWRLFLRSAKPAELHVWGFDLPGDERQGSGQMVAGSPPGAPARPHERFDEHNG